FRNFARLIVQSLECEARPAAARAVGLGDLLQPLEMLLVGAGLFQPAIAHFGSAIRPSAPRQIFAVDISDHPILARRLVMDDIARAQDASRHAATPVNPSSSPQLVQ